jgi:hypothetical protein
MNVDAPPPRHQAEPEHQREQTRERVRRFEGRERGEAGWERAMDKIAERAGLTKGPDTRR